MKTRLLKCAKIPRPISSESEEETKVTVEEKVDNS